MLLPFESLPETRFVVIDGLHLLQCLGTSPDEEPFDYQAQIRSQVRYLLIMEQAAIRLAEREGIALTEAKKRVSAVSKPEPGRDKTEAGLLFYQTFTADEAAQLIEANAAQSNRLDQAVKAATYFIRNRIAYPVRITGIVEASSKPVELPIARLAYPIADKQKLKLDDDCILTIDGFHAVGSKTLKVKATPRPIAADSIGYLLDIETGDYRLGNAEWTEAHTRSSRLLKLETIGKIYQFYLAEKAGISEWEAFTLLVAENEAELEDEAAGKPEFESLEDLPEPSRSIGDSSTGDFSISDAATVDSATKTLVGSLAG